jgi:hypothetical protein
MSNIVEAHGLLFMVQKPHSHNQTMPLPRRASEVSTRLAAILAISCASISGLSFAEDAAQSSQLKPESTSPSALEAPPAPAIVKATLHTEIGDILIGLDQAHAPITVNNFLRYVDLKRFDGSTFYRAVKIDEEGKYGLV